jgi:thymidylate synthase
VTQRSFAAFWKKPIGELCAFINGVTTVRGLREFGCDWWAPWTSADRTQMFDLREGELGPGSYGGAFHSFPNPDGSSFDQFTTLAQRIRDSPMDRTHFVSPWIPAYQFPGAGFGKRAVVSPCHGWIHFRVLDGELHLHMFQRAGDLIIGVPSNMIQYGALLLMMAHLTGYLPGTFFHTISDGHIYESQLPAAETMLAREPMPLPTVRLTRVGLNVCDIHLFRAHHFELESYRAHSVIANIPVPL